jgi:predicted metalloenzyme YecM
MTFDELGAEIKPLIDATNTFATNYNLVGKAAADHLGYDCASSERFNELREVLENESVYLYQSIIAGRRIAIFKLLVPFETVLGNVSVFELADQKPDGSQVDGIEHIEIYPHHDSFEGLVTYIQKQGIEGKQSVTPHHTTHKFPLSTVFTLKLEPCALLDKIKNEEM